MSKIADDIKEVGKINPTTITNNYHVDKVEPQNVDQFIRDFKTKIDLK